MISSQVIDTGHIVFCVDRSNPNVHSRVHEVRTGSSIVLESTFNPPPSTHVVDSHLDTRIKRCILMNVTVPNLQYAGEVWEGHAKFVNSLKQYR